jgi:hypothetical protein
MVNYKGQLYGKIKAQVKVCQKAFDKSLHYRAMSELYIVDTEKQREWLTKRLMAEAACQRNDERLIHLMNQYKQIEFL